jgi:murein endopeptidase
MPTFARAFYIAYFFIVGLLSQPRGRRKQGFAVAYSSFNVVVDMFILLAMKNISVTVKKKKNISVMLSICSPSKGIYEVRFSSNQISFLRERDYFDKKSQY